MNRFSRRNFLKLGTGSLAVGLITQQGCNMSKTDLSALGKTPNTKFAVNVEMWWDDLPFMDHIEKVAELGFPAIEFWGYKEKDLAAIRQKCDELGLVITQFTAWGFKPGMNDSANQDLFEQKIREACEVTKKLGVKLATVVGGDNQPGMTQEVMYQNIITALKRVEHLQAVAM
jgi:hydroxypyruvate isomerase